MDRSSAALSGFGEYAAVHHRVGPALVGRTPKHSNVRGKVVRPRSHREQLDRYAHRGADLVEGSARAFRHRRPYLGRQVGERVVAERLAGAVQFVRAADSVSSES